MKKITSKFIQFLLVIVTAFSLFPLTAMAAIQTDMHMEAREEIPKNWDAMADTSWYNEKYKEFHLSTPEQLAGLAVLVNNGNYFEGKTICLNNDINLNGYNWIPIGSQPEEWYKFPTINFFCGTFDGQNHCIRNLTTDSSSYSHGLFGLAKYGTIKNVKIIDAYIHNNDNVSNNNYIGILADEVVKCNILGSYTTGKIIDYSTNVKYVGGIVGRCEGASKIIGCYSTATILNNSSNPSYESVGGLIGCWIDVKNDSMISNCWYDGSIQCKGHPFTGGILGNSNYHDVKIKNCFVSTTNITCQTPDRVALITTTGTDDSVSDCYWPASATDQSDNMKNDPVNKTNYKIWFSKDTEFDASKCGMAIENFQDPSFVDKLNENADPGVAWVKGVNHPTFVNDDEDNITASDAEITAAKQKVDHGFDFYSKQEEIQQKKMKRWQRMFKS